MGALIATYVFYDRPLDIAGLIFIAPLVLMNPESATRGKMLFSKMVNHLLPNAPLGYIDPQATSRDEAQVFNDCYHELQNELPEVAAEVMLLIDNWLEARLPK
ncbi:hypothetical protein chiPu_0014047 [Chiloscyllium punctatum]|uniref:Serine aminopeptidase S33 domain-containing protein n=1 Tax=Chiloscyllium punctatum TaxID=137246 RepID=A0A401SYT0_CHIPU|nr:hypothetical protein [Chiloscyllium punctatum]